MSVSRDNIMRMIPSFLQRVYERVCHSDIGYRLASGAFWSFTGTALAKFLVLISSVFCARILGSEAFGELGIIRSTIGLFVTLGAAGLGLTASKYISEYRGTGDGKKIGEIYLLSNGFACITGLIVSIAIIFLSNYLATDILKAPHIEFELKIGGFILFITVLNGAQNGVLSGFESFKIIAINTFIVSVIESVLIILGSFFYGVIGALIGFGISYILLFILNNISIRNLLKHSGVKLNTHLSKETLSILYKFSLPAMFSSLLVTPIFWAIKAMLANHDGFSEVGIYEVADQWKLIILFIPSAISQIVLPILSNVKTSDVGNQKYNKVLWLNISLNSGVCLVLSLLILCLSPYILHLYGDEYENKWPLIILAFSTIFTSISQVVGLAIVSLGKMWLGTIFNLIWALILLASNYIYLEVGLGATGVALALFTSYFIHTVIQLLYFKFNLKYK